MWGEGSPYRRSDRLEDHLRRLKVAAIDVDATRERGQLELRSWTETVSRCFGLMEDSARLGHARA